jgi:hypothetical protein
MHASLSHQLFICCSVCSRKTRGACNASAGSCIVKILGTISHYFAATKIKLTRKVIIVVYWSKSLCRAKSNVVNGHATRVLKRFPSWNAEFGANDRVPHCRSPSAVLYTEYVSWHRFPRNVHEARSHELGRDGQNIYAPPQPKWKRNGPELGSAASACPIRLDEFQ